MSDFSEVALDEIALAARGRIDDALVLAIALRGNMGSGPLSRGEFCKRAGVITAIGDDMA